MDIHLIIWLVEVSAWCLSGSVLSLDIGRCPNQTINTYVPPCSECGNLKGCLHGDTKVPNTTVDCTYELLLLDLMFELPGCTFTCEAVYQVPQCCHGYWGEDCRPCPGGADLPCGGRGECSDGIDGTGVCQCKEGITGTVCELCADKDAYGPDCDQQCQCQNGRCSGSGIHGNGSCDCFSGYEGKFCDQAISSCDTKNCQANAKCTEGEEGPVCECLSGYSINGLICEELNPCEGPTHCHENATCLPTGVLSYNCSCLDGFLGDGTYCEPIDPCQENYGGCDRDTSDCVYLSPNKSSCVCIEGFIADPQYGGCMIEDLCPSQGHKCHKQANCSTLDPGIVSCTCQDGYVGDGTVCYGNILEQMYELNTNNRKLQAQLSSFIHLVEFALKDGLTIRGPFTIFIPTDAAFSMVNQRTWYTELFVNVGLARYFLLNHLIGWPLRIEELTNKTDYYTLSGLQVNLNYQHESVVLKISGNYRKVAVLEKDVIASNGVIHVVNQVLISENMVWLHQAKKPFWETIQSLSTLATTRALFRRMKDQGFDFQDLTKDQWTFFLPRNSAFKSLLEGTIEHLKNSNQKDKLKALIEHHIVRGRIINITDLLDMKKIVTSANNGIKVMVTDQGQIQLGSKSVITMSQLEFTNGVIHVIDNLLIPDSIGTLLPRFCPKIQIKEVKGECGDCSSNHCERNTDIPTKKIDEECIYGFHPPFYFPHDHAWEHGYHGRRFYPIGRFRRSIQPMPIPKFGCRKICNRTIDRIEECCPNFYGQECYPCMGGHENPCFGRGRCLDGLSSNGSCVCDPPFTGTGCEICVDKNKYGPYCNQTCGCLRGECDNRVGSHGDCKGSCDEGYIGVFCHLHSQKCSRHLRCHIHADCVKKSKRKGELFGRRNRYKCQCKRGYTGSGISCEEIDPCKTGDLQCHVDAGCKKTGPGQGVCSCNNGWVGDGFYCFPSTACETKEHCDVNAKCVTVTPGHSHCRCNEYYHGNGTVCLPVNVCENNFIGCDQYAVCNSTGPGEGTCTCDTNLAGDGFSCYGDIAFQLQYVSELQEVYKLTNLIPKKDRFLSDFRTNFTLFAPNSTAVVELLEQEDSAWTSAERNLILLLRYHTLAMALKEDDLRNMNGQRLLPLVENFYLNVSVSEGDIFINDAKIIKTDIPALNGFIHVVDKILEPYPPPELLPSLGDILQNNPKFSLFYYLLKKYDWLGPDGLLADEIAQSMYQYTVFVPVNSAWEGRELLNLTSSRYLKSFFLVNERFTWSDLMEKDGERLPSMLGSSTGQSITVTAKNNNTMLINNVEVILSGQRSYDGYVYGIQSLLEPVLNFCPEKGDPMKCCSGYYGDSCKECPGGADNACSGRGVCQPSGICKCESPYTGAACDLCEPEECTSVDYCSIKNGGCHPFAECQLSQKLVECRCVEGYIGDGYQCMSPCHIERGGCHDNATCELEYKKPRCECNAGFSGSGRHCILIPGACDFNNGGCSVHAQCSYKEAEKEAVVCHCKEAYTGDGFTCLADSWQTLKDIAEEEPSIKPFVKMLRNPENIHVKRLLENELKNITVFVPVSGNLTDMQAASFVSESVVLLDNSQNSDLTVQCVDLSNLYITVDYNDSETDELEFYANGVRILLKNLMATNGVLHLIEIPYTVHIGTGKQPQKQQSRNKTLGLTRVQHLSVWGGLGVLVLVAIVILLSVLGWRKRDSIRVSLHRMRSANGFKFQNLQEDDGGEQSTSSPSVAFHSGSSTLEEESSEARIEDLPVSQK